MKKSTQLKILRFVEKLIGYNHPAIAIHPEPKFMGGKIQLFKMDWMCSEYENMMFNPTMVLKKNLIEKIVYTPGVIKVDTEKKEEGTLYHVSCYVVQFHEEIKNPQ